jgi:hypothetical protein
MGHSSCLEILQNNMNYADVSILCYGDREISHDIASSLVKSFARQLATVAILSSNVANQKVPMHLTW